MSKILGSPLYYTYTYKTNKSIKLEMEGLLLLDLYNELEFFSYETLSDKQISDLFEKFHSYRHHPYINLTTIFTKSDRLYLLKDYDASIVNYNTAIEVFINIIVLKHFTLMKVKSEKDAKLFVADISYKKLIYKHFHRILDELGIKHLSEIKNLTEKYLSTSYLIRNDIVHQGKSFGEKEATDIKNLAKDLVYIVNYNFQQVTPNNFIKFHNEYSLLDTSRDYDKIIKAYQEY